MVFANSDLAGRLEAAEADALRAYIAALRRLRPQRGAASLDVAGGCAVSMRRGVATLFSAATRPLCRGQGVQTALIRARLAHAAATGCDLAMVRTTPGSGSQRNVERAGFRVAYTKLVLARGQPPPQSEPAGAAPGGRMLAPYPRNRGPHLEAIRCGRPVGKRTK